MGGSDLKFLSRRINDFFRILRKTENQKHKGNGTIPKASVLESLLEISKLFVITSYKTTIITSSAIRCVSDT